MKLNTKIIIAATLLLFTISACRKIQEDNLIKGLWQVESISIDTSTMLNRNTTFVRNLIDTANARNGNYLNAFLDGYTANSSNAYYRIDYQRDGIVFTYYNIGDSNVYSTIGKWELPKNNLLIQKVDKFLDGQFTIKQLNTTSYSYKSTNNYIKFLDDTVSLEVKIKKVP
ncbi:MAG: hypothetical protein M9931_02705 [Chitinophagales bacterium]|nr:hypothetical protein [Chitinophagales bacterium]MCO5279948.1 hypothetical protein [Chitinophagales bacterium]OJV28262.1 MAG: hypothetical protein BGO32_05345 [Bacteroidetes bacterium 37-13]HRN93846.1 hypothetical protein [Chitinophagales bacterium]HRP40408.1 hypothetical protein [Chitinophagales bacterium]